MAAWGGMADSDTIFGMYVKCVSVIILVSFWDSGHDLALDTGAVWLWFSVVAEEDGPRGSESWNSIFWSPGTLTNPQIRGR